MKATLTIVCALLLCGALATAQEGQPAAPETAPVTTAQSSYAVGAEIGRNMQRQEVELDLDQFVKGFTAAYTGGALEMTDEQIRAAVMALQKVAMEKQQVKMKEQAVKAKAEGETFLAANKGTEGVVTLPSGLQYKVLAEGTGASPTDQDRVKVHYRGTLIDGTEFDSSYSRNQPAEFPVTGVITGWTEALQLMREGAKWQLFIPSDLAYGERGGGHKIPPNATLLFEVELLEVKAKSAPQPATEQPGTTPTPDER
jgi:FKBP-type peptidyl-prolyl cis-trans isomerase FklB